PRSLARITTRPGTGSRAERASLVAGTRRRPRTRHVPPGSPLAMTAKFPPPASPLLKFHAHGMVSISAMGGITDQVTIDEIPAKPAPPEPPPAPPKPKPRPTPGPDE